MRKDFKSYCSDHKDSPPEQPKINMNYDDAVNFAKQYEGKNQSEIMGDILSLASKGKKDGSINIEQIEGFANTLAPSLNAEQKAKLAEVLKLIKNT